MSLYHIDANLKNSIDEIVQEIIENNYDVIEIDNACDGCDIDIVFSCFDNHPAFTLLKQLQLQGIRGYRFDCNVLNLDREKTIIRKYDMTNINDI